MTTASIINQALLFERERDILVQPVNPLYYLGTPYGHDEAGVREARYRLNVLALTDLLHMGLQVFSPVVHHHPVACLRDLGRDFSYWQAQDFAFLERSNALIVLTVEGWQGSKGLASEVTEARRLRLPVFFWDGKVTPLRVYRQDQALFEPREVQNFDLR